MSAPAWMPLYIGDYLADTQHLSTVEHGAYLLLIMHYWQNGALPDDEKGVARITRMAAREWKVSRDTLAALFSENWTHKRIDAELGRASAIISSKGVAGAAGAESRWKNRGGHATRSKRLADARQKGTHTPAEWLAMLDVFGVCVRCEVPNEDLHGGKCLKDHIVPLYQGGSDSIDNIQPMCRNCNSAKGPETVDYRAVRVPEWRALLQERIASIPKSPFEKRLTDALQTPAHVRAQLHHQEITPLVQSSTPAEEKKEAAGMEQAEPSASIEISPALRNSRLLRKAS